MTDFVQQPVVQALAWALMHFLWQGAAIGLVVLVCARLVRSASVRYAIGVGALAAMLAAPTATFLIVLSESAGRVGVTPAPATVTEPAAADARPLTAPAEPAPSASSSSLPLQVSPDVLAVAVMGWIAGVAFFSIRLLGGWVVARRLSRNAVRPASEAIQVLARELCDRLQVRRAVRILESSTLAVPVVVGWIKPAIVLPLAALANLTPTQVEALLAHELAHVRRHDYLVNLLQSLTEAFLFYHPAVWWLSRQVRADRELCCDDLAVGVCDRLVYATALTDLATLASPRVALAATDGNLLGRIRRILGHTEETAAIRAGVVPALALALVAGVAVPVVLASATSVTSAPETPVVPQETALRLIDEVAPALPGDRAAVAFDTFDLEQTPAQQAERQRQIEAIRKQLEALHQELARLEENRGAAVDARAVRAEIEKSLMQARQGANAEQRKALAALQQDVEKMYLEQAGAAERQQNMADKQALARALEVMAAKQSYEDLRRQFEKGLITQQQLSEAEAALTRVEAQGNPNALAQVDRAAAERQLQRTRTLFEKGLMTERQLQDAELALQRARAADDPRAEAAIRLNQAQTEFSRRMDLFQKGLVTQQSLDEARLQLVLLEQQLNQVRRNEAAAQAADARVATDARALQSALEQRLQRLPDRGYAVEASLERAPNQEDPVKSGDILRITITGEPDLPTTYHVTPDGTIRLPFLGVVKVVGLKASDVRTAVGKQLSDRKLGSATQVAVTLMRAR